MAMASPTPMGSSHFASLSRRPSSRQAYKQPPWRPHLSRGEPHVAETHTRHYSVNDSSDDEIPMPMKLSAYTDALLNGETSMVEKSPLISARTNPGLDGMRQFRAGSVSSIEVDRQDRISPPGSRVHSPYPRRVIRLSGTPGSSTLKRNKSLSTVVQKYNEPVTRAESPLDLSTPAQVPRTVRIPITATAHNGVSAGSSGKLSSRTNSGSRSGEEEAGSQEQPTTIARSHLATSQGSVSKYGSSTIGRTRYDEDLGLASSMRVRKVPGRMMAQAARRGRRRVDDEGQSPLEQQSDDLENAGSSSEPKSQESQVPESQVSDLGSSQDPEANRASLYSTAYRDFASGSPLSSKDILNPILRSKSPPPPTLSSSQRSATADSNPLPAKKEQPIFKVPAPRPDLPSAHDQENEAPPTFKRNKQAPLIQFDKMEKMPIRPESLDLDILRAAVSPERRPLASRSQNTPRRPAPPPPPPKMSILDAATSTAGAATTTQAGAKKNRLKVNGKQFTRLDCIGRGGSSRVYRVMAENSQFFALKRVSLEDADEMAVAGFKGEIDLLQKLKGVDRVIRLWDYELNEAKGTLSVLMEMGELDLNKILEMRLKTEQSKFDVSFVRHYWKEMLECLQAIHAHDIVHSDLKPHNFVLVKGQLKLIDFGIANAIQTDETVNVHRETQIGTPNYMSPESLMDSNAKPDSRGRISNEPKLMKLGKPSDIWSLGCILYQMVYGRAPFAHIQNQMQRCQAIINFNYPIEYPTVGVGNIPVPASLIGTLKKCLNRDQHQRPSATDLLNDKDPFLNPDNVEGDPFPMTEELLGRIILNVAAKCKDRSPTHDDLMKLWPKGYLDNLRSKLREGKPV